MLTFFTVPKAFTEPYIAIQKNSIESWKMACPNCQILILGNEEGNQEICKELDVPYIPSIRYNVYNTPFLDSAFEIARGSAKFDILCYCNTDIILIANLPKILKTITFDKFLLIGQRIDYNEPIEFEHLNIEKIKQEGRLHAITGIDYFIFTKSLFQKLPPYLIGRRGWDNWLVYKALKEASVIDCTSVICAIHQNHPQKLIKGDEYKYNFSLISYEASHTYISHAQYKFQGMEVTKK